MDILKTQGHLPPETDDSGNVEYKRSLTNKEDKYEKLSAQLSWRIDEGFKVAGIPEAIYYLGLDDDGTVAGVQMEDIDISITALDKIASLVQASITNTDVAVFDNGVVGQITIRKTAKIRSEEARVCFVGKSDNGKSTLIGVLTNGHLDNGKGSARMSVFRHDGEMDIGKTFAIKHDIIGYKGFKPLNYTSNAGLSGTWENIVTKASRVIDLIDLPGDDKYQNTTFNGLMSYQPNLVVIVVSALNVKNNNLDTTNFYIKTLDQLQIPYLVVITKIDLCPDINTTIFPGPVLKVSNKTGEGIPEFHNKLATIDTERILKEPEYAMDMAEFTINDSVYIPDIGVVVGGILRSGQITLGDTLTIGPSNNSFHEVKIISIHKKRVPVSKLVAGESGSFVIKISSGGMTTAVNKHMVILNRKLISRFKRRFHIKVYDPSNINENNGLYIFYLNVKDQVRVVSVDEDVVEVEFINNKVNYVRPGIKCMVRVNGLDLRPGELV